MTDWNTVTLASLVARFPAGAWDVLRGVDAPDGLPIYGTYPSLLVGLDALQAGGYRPACHSIPAPELDGPYDLTTMLRFTAGEGQDVVLVRRLRS